MELKAQKRKRIGKKVRSLRKEGLIPAVVFGKGLESINLKVNKIEFLKTYREAGETEIIDLNIEGEEQISALVDEIQVDPISGDTTHVNFKHIDLSKPIRVQIPIIYKDQEDHPLIKNGTAIFLTQISEIEIEVLPKNLPRGFELSISKIEEVGDTLTLKDLKSTIDTSVITILEEDDDLVIGSLDYAIQPEIETEEDLTEEEMIEGVETTEQKEGEEGEEGENKEEEGEKPEESKEQSN